MNFPSTAKHQALFSLDITGSQAGSYTVNEMPGGYSFDVGAQGQGSPWFVLNNQYVILPGQLDCVVTRLPDICTTWNIPVSPRSPLTASLNRNTPSQECDHVVIAV